MNDIEPTVITDDIPFPAASADAGPVLMIRSPKAGGPGVTKMHVPASEVANFILAGWHRA